MNVVRDVDDVVQSSSLEECQAACLDNDNFLCRSIDYTINKECRMSRHSLIAEESLNIGVGLGADHSEWYCGGKY